MKYFFFKTVTDKGRNRLRPLSHQTLDGVEVDSTLNVQSDKVIRSMYPLGTIFGSDYLRLCSGYYDSGKLFPLGLKPDEYKLSEHRPPFEMQKAYEDFIGASGSEFRSAESPSEGFTEEPSKVTLLSKMKSNRELNVPEIKSSGFYVAPENWYLLLRNITNQVNTMIIGPTGTGKTELVMLACERLGVPCHVYDMGSMYDPVSGLLGVHRLQEGGVSTFDYAKFTRDISEPGVVLLDELSRAPVTTNNILFPCLDSRRTLPVEIAGGDDLRSIKVHEDCCFIATANVGSEYTGTMSMDRALVGRFFPLELDYMPDDKEVQILTKRCGISKSDAVNIVLVANNVRSLYRKQELSCSLSTRETLMAAELVSDGWSVLSAMELVFLPLFEGTKSDGERGIICKTIMVR